MWQTFTTFARETWATSIHLTILCIICPHHLLTSNYQIYQAFQLHPRDTNGTEVSWLWGTTKLKINSKMMTLATKSPRASMMSDGWCMDVALSKLLGLQLVGYTIANEDCWPWMFKKGIIITQAAWVSLKLPLSQVKVLGLSRYSIKIDCKHIWGLLFSMIPQHSPGLGLEQQPETSNNCGSHHQSHLDTNVLVLAGFGEQLQSRNETMYKRTG